MTGPPPVPRCVLLSGTAGTGKTTLCRLGDTAMRAAWGGPAAAVDLDTLYAAVDPLWELTYTDERNAMVLAQAAGWVRSLVGHGWPTVLVAGNSVYDPYDTGPFVAALPPELAVHHVTLRVRADVLLARCAGQPGRDPAALAADLQHENRLQHPGTAVLDSSGLDPGYTLTELVRLVDAEAGLIRRPVG